MTMWRRTVGCLITLVLGIAVALPSTEAQQQGKIPRVGVLDPGPRQRPSPCLPAFQQGMRDLGYVEGQHILFEYRYAEGQPDRLPALATELVRLAPDVIWLHSTPTALVARRVIKTIPLSSGSVPILRNSAASPVWRSPAAT
jgi:putative tryptophan/tyrosine transport system substrate-binding protein